MLLPRTPAIMADDRDRTPGTRRRVRGSAGTMTRMTHLLSQTDCDALVGAARVEFRHAGADSGAIAAWPEGSEGLPHIVLVESHAWTGTWQKGPGERWRSRHYL